MDGLPLQESEEGVSIRVRVQPRASRDEVSEVRDGAVWVRVTAPPIGGEANVRCCRVIADFFGVRACLVKVLYGHKSRDKVILVGGMSGSDAAVRMKCLGTDRI